jgi:arylsulfatase
MRLGKPFFLYLPFSMGHTPNLPAKEFAGKSRIGDYGDKIMEGDYHIGQVLDALKELGVDDDTIVIFASDNGPWGEVAREFGNQGTPDMGSSGPFRGELGEGSEGSIRTFAFVRWPGHVKSDTSSYAMFSIMDFMPTLAGIVGGKMPTDRPIDGVDQSDVLFGKSALGHREALLCFIGPELEAVRWKQWRIYLTDVHPTGIGPQIGYNFQVNRTTVYADVRAYWEFDSCRRLQGHAVYATLNIPLSGFFASRRNSQ